MKRLPGPTGVVLLALSLSAAGCAAGGGTMDAGGGGKTGAGGSAGGGGAGTTGGRGGATGGQAGASAGTTGTAGSAAGGGGTAGGGATAGTGGATGTAGASAGTTGTGGVAGASGGAGGAGAAGSGGGRGGSGGSGRGGAGGQAGAICAIAAAGEMVMSLAGTWTFTPSGAAATTIQVPGGGWIAQGFSRASVTAARYDRMVTVPDLGRPQATYLEFGAVNHQATLTVDSTMVGTNTTSFTPSVFDVSKVVKPGMAQHFVVDVKGRDALHSSTGTLLVPDGANWSPNIPQGIFRSATLHVVPALHVADAFVRTDVANDQISVEVTITNDGAAAANGTVTVALSSWNCDANSYPALPSVPISALAAGMSVKVTLGPVKWGLGSASYWWPNVPYTPGYVAKLHVAAVTVTPDATGGGAAAAHTVPYRFGFRQVRQVASAGGVVGHYELNGVRFNFRGDNIQGADYDSINVTGKGNGDAYDLFPGFLPPSGTNRGFPGAVDNWEKLSYNGTRIHQVLATPYMLDVMDEMGFMAIGETAIRGEGSSGQDYVQGHDNMVAHLTAMIVRDRNHPSIVRWSQCNEAENGPNSSKFQQDLFNAATAADGTRPVSADMYPGGTRSVYPTSPNFAAFAHYPNGTGAYTSSVDTNTTTPFGDGEFIWPSDNSKKGLVWFGTSTMTLRQKDASDIRPYTLLSGWASFIPGVKRTMMTIESLNTNPVFGEDNLPDPWSNPIITRIQRAFNPVAVADVAYWDANHASNDNGDWPVSKETVTKASKLSRQLVVFNDTFAGTAVDVSWEMHQDSATGALADQGTVQLNIPLGQHTTTTIQVSAPASGTTAVLILQSSKNGQVIFRDDGQVFTLK